jgi:polysaccharide pyruvyl transferase WcaK-like protein
VLDAISTAIFARIGPATMIRSILAGLAAIPAASIVQPSARAIEQFEHGVTRDRETKRKKIAFFGNFDSSNFGNEGTLQTILYQLRRFHPDAEVVCISTGPEATVSTHQIEAIPITERLVKFWSPKNPTLRVVRKACIGVPGEFLRWAQSFLRLKHVDMLIVPGTGLLTDACGLWGAAQPYSVFKWSLMAKLCNCKLVFVSVGAGPIYGTLGRTFVKLALSLADFRSYRDQSTMQYLESIGFRKDKDQVNPDLVFSFPEASIPTQDPKKNRKCVGLGLMDYVGRYSVSNPTNETYVLYLENLARVVMWLLAHEYDVRLLSGDLGDVHVREELKELLRERLSMHDQRRIIDEPVLSVENLLAQIAATDVIVATRFHNVLFAFLCNKPVISISFHHKCESLMSAMELSEYCLDINDLKANRLIEAFCDLEANASKVKLKIKDKVDEFRAMLDEQYKLIFDGRWFNS